MHNIIFDLHFEYLIKFKQDQIDRKTLSKRKK